MDSTLYKINYIIIVCVSVLQVYGETSFELVDQMIKSIEFSGHDTFVDLGSGTSTTCTTEQPHTLKAYFMQHTITRYNSSHIYQHIRTDKDSYKYSFYPRTIIQWNLLPIHVHEAVTVDAFKALVPVTVLAPIYHV